MLRIPDTLEVRSSPGGVAGVRMVGAIGIVETISFPRGRSVRVLDLNGRELAGTLPVPAGRTRYLELRNELLLTKRGDRSPYTYTVFDIRDPRSRRSIESIRARTRFWSHAIEQLDTPVEPIALPADV